ncbi:MAG: hypothetical protein KGD61_06775, partial [Candidatus Lokiarchaeota archaeon]|nr:hypothetical protein [Candidatus Lokiarchaeota archaeon]
MNVKEIKGRTDFSSGQFLGYVLWKQSDGFHLRWTTKGKKENAFQGKIVCQTKVLITKTFKPESKDKIKKTGGKTIEWNTTVKGDIDGLDFLTPGDFELELRIDNKKVKPKIIFLGPEMIQPESNPFTIIQLSSEKKFQPKRTSEIKKQEPEPKPVYEPTQEPELEPTYEPTPELEPEPVYEPTPEPEPVYEPTQEPEPEPVYEPTPEPEPKPVYEPTQEPEPEPTYEPTPEPEPKPVYEPTQEPEPEPTYEPTHEPEPIYEPTPEPIYQPTAEPEPEPIYQPTSKPEPEPIYESTPEPVYEPIPEPESEPIYEPTPQPVYEPIPES